MDDVDSGNRAVTRRTMRALPVLAAMLAVGGCRAQEPTNGAPRADAPAPAISPTPPPPPVGVPPVSDALPTIRDQVQKRYDELIAHARSNGDAPTLAEEYGAFGQLLMAAKLYDTAEQAFANARYRAPADPRWHYYMATLLRKKGALDEAVAEYTRTLELDATNVAAHVWLGKLYLDLGRPDAAKDAYTRALSFGSTYAAEFGFGRAALDRKEYGVAIEHLERALSLAPDANIVHYSLALAYRGAGQPARADEHFKARGVTDYEPDDPLMAILPPMLDDPVGYYQRGLRAFTQGAFDEAITDYKAALALNPEDWRLRESLRYNLAATYLRTNNTQAAEEHFKAGIRAVPDRPEHYYGLGLVLMAKGRPRDAIVQFSAAVKRDPSYRQATAALAEAQRVAANTR